ncbi:MAG: hypothetical protein KBG19_06755 [Bacteroidales bacterium]|nr:hypothetical protein [Bacteroidales bacterium]
MSKPKRSSDDYVHLNKKITNKDHIKVLKEIARENGVGNKEAAYLLLCQAMKKEFEKRNNLGK